MVENILKRRVHFKVPNRMWRKSRLNEIGNHKKVHSTQFAFQVSWISHGNETTALTAAPDGSSSSGSNILSKTSSRITLLSKMNTTHSLVFDYRSCLLTCIKYIQTWRLTSFFVPPPSRLEFVQRVQTQQFIMKIYFGCSWIEIAKPQMFWSK